MPATRAHPADGDKNDGEIGDIPDAIDRRDDIFTIDLDDEIYGLPE